MSKPRQRIRANHNKHTARPSRFPLFVRKSGDKFVEHKPKERAQTYREAVLVGQAVSGYGNFYVDTGDWVPPREVQLLEVQPTARQSKLKSILDTI